METRSIGKTVLYYNPGDEAAADLVERACACSLDLIRELWRLEPPDECQVHVMTSWRQFLFGSAPAAWRIYLALTLPLRRARIQQVWDLAGGWALRYGERHVVGIKPPRLLEQMDEDVRTRVFVPREADEAVQHNVCHELVHACSEHLHLPTWLHEGLAMVTVDRFAQRPTVKAETLDALLTGSKENALRRGGDGQAGLEGLLHRAVRGYWIVRLLEEAHPGFVRSLLDSRHPAPWIEKRLAARLGLDPERLDERLTAMARRGLVFDLSKGEKRYVSLAPVVIGFFELTFMRAGDDLPRAELARLFEEYFFEGDGAFAEAVFGGHTQVGRSLVRETALPKDATEVLDHERATRIAETATSAAVSLCACRHHSEHLGTACDAPRRVCLSFGAGADALVRTGQIRHRVACPGMERDAAQPLAQRVCHDRPVAGQDRDHLRPVPGRRGLERQEASPRQPGSARLIR